METDLAVVSHFHICNPSGSIFGYRVFVSKRRIQIIINTLLRVRVLTRS